MKKSICSILLLASASFLPSDSDACTRILYQGHDSLYVVARSLDWKTPIPTNLYVYPSGISKVSSDRPDALTWTSKYGAVYAVGYDGGITEGMNEKGLVVNGLFCKNTIYVNSETAGRPPMSLAVFVAWMIDQCETTAQVVDLLENIHFSIGGATFDGGTVSQLHWGVTDATGHSVIFEYDNGEIKIHEMGNYLAMTNDPQWPQMTAIMDYWEKIGGQHMLPGTVTSPDRCVRANYFAHHVEKTSDSNLAMSIARSILVNSAVPYTYKIEGEPNLSSTQWYSLSNLRDRLYGFELVTNPGYIWIDLKKCNLSKGAHIMKLNTADAYNYCGEANAHLKKSEPFNPMW